ncbi:hypothetical protein [Nitrosomonas sp.]|uniref:hypothetical protein n=1 Tax=Nitrosomonas sp. TaxID=42353 RepID=UPI0025D1FD90|nr:hypothetical protein [Nitrosomonas sp.]
MRLIFIVFGMGNASLFAAGFADTNTIQKAVAAYKTIETLRKETPINGDAIASAYTGALQILAQEAEINSLKLNSDILVAIEEIKSGNEPRLATQVIDKTLQRVFYQSILNRITMIQRRFNTATSAELIQMLDDVVAAFQAITGTVARTNEILSADRQTIISGSNPALDVQFNESVARIRRALDKSNPEEDSGVIAVEFSTTRIALAQAYYIGVLRTVASVLENRSTDPETTAVSLKEGEFFYRIIESLVAQGNRVGNQLIKAQLAGNAANVVAYEIVSELIKGFVGQVYGEMSYQSISIGVNRFQAMSEASGAAAYARVFLPDVEVRLGAEVRGNLETALSNLQTASSENSVPKSAAARDAIAAILLSYQKELNLIDPRTTIDTGFVYNASTSYYQISGYRAENPVNAEAIAAAYTGELQQLTQIIDLAYGLTIDQNVLAAIENVRNGNQVALASQVIDKSIQRVFALAIYNRTTLVLDNFDSLATDKLALEWDRVETAYLAIMLAVGKVNKVLTKDKQTLKDEAGPDPYPEDQFSLAFLNGREALSKANANDRTTLAIARENIIVPLVRGFLNGVLHEVEGVIANRSIDVDEARVGQLGGDLLYRTVEVFIAQDNPSGNDRIKAQLTGDLADVVANEIVSDINKGVIGQFRRNISQIESTFGVDRNRALLASERISLYATIFLPDLELRLGTQQRVKMQNALQDLREAIETDNSAKAITAGSTITEIISAYEDELV